MRPIPATRLGDAHGLLRAINERQRMRLDEFVTEFTVDELFPPGLENALGRTRQFVSFARAAGLVNEDRGTVELTDLGKRYVRAGDEKAPFDIAPAQAEWLRRTLRERHMSDSIYHGAAVGLSLCASAPPGFHASALDFGRALSHLGRAGWDNDNTFGSQGRRYTTFLRDIELIDAERKLTDAGRALRDELTLPIHMSLRDLAGQLNPGGLEAAEREGEEEWAAAQPAPEEEPAAAPEPAEPAVAEPEAAAPAGAAPPPAPAPAEYDEYEDVGPVAARPEPGSEPPPPPPPPPPLAPTPPAPASEPQSPPPPPPAPGTPPPPGPPSLDFIPAAPPPPARPSPEEVVAAGAATVASRPVAAPAAQAPGTSIGIADLRAAADEAGLKLPDDAYAAVAAALAGGHHVVLTGPPGSGKTTLALAIAKAAVLAGQAQGATVVTAGRRWSAGDTLGQERGEEWEAGLVINAAGRERWLVIDELDRADLDRALGDLSSFLSGVPVAMPDAERTAPPGWRIVATSVGPLRGSPALVRRFAHVKVPRPSDEQLHAAIDAAAGGDATAAAAVKRLLGARELGPIGTAPFLDAARFAAARNAAAPAHEITLAREALGGFVAPVLGRLDDDRRARLMALAG